MSEAKDEETEGTTESAPAWEIRGDGTLKVGGMVISSPTTVSPPSAPTSGGSWTTSAGPITFPAKGVASGIKMTTGGLVTPPAKLVDLPPRITKKVLVAFLEDGSDKDDVAWGKVLRAKEVTISHDEDGTAEMNVVFSLVDYGD